MPDMYLPQGNGGGSVRTSFKVSSPSAKPEYFSFKEQAKREIFLRRKGNPLYIRKLARNFTEFSVLPFILGSLKGLFKKVCLLLSVQSILRNSLVCSGWLKALLR